jgi:integrase
MHCCGIRTGEARALLTEHVDLGRQRIDIITSKGNRSRRLPLTGQVVKVLSACDQVSRARSAGRATFFVSAAGNQVSPASVGVIFNRIWDQAGLARTSDGQAPRPYDFRHHFAYVNIERWAAQGADVAAMLPYLARYMGHASFESTYYYVHTSPDFMAGYAHIAASSASVLPEVGFE